MRRVDLNISMVVIYIYISICTIHTMKVCNTRGVRVGLRFRRGTVDRIVMKRELRQIVV